MNASAEDSSKTNAIDVDQLITCCQPASWPQQSFVIPAKIKGILPQSALRLSRALLLLRIQTILLLQLILLLLHLLLHMTRPVLQATMLLPTQFTQPMAALTTCLHRSFHYDYLVHTPTQLLYW